MNSAVRLKHQSMLPEQVSVNPIPLLWLNCWVGKIVAPDFFLLCETEYG